MNVDRVNLLVNSGALKDVLTANVEKYPGAKILYTYKDTFIKNVGRLSTDSLKAVSEEGQKFVEEMSSYMMNDSEIKTMAGKVEAFAQKVMQLAAGGSIKL